MASLKWLIPGLLLSAPASAAPRAALMLLDNGDTVTVIDAYEISEATVNALQLHVIAPQNSASQHTTDNDALVAIRFRSLEQWTQVLPMLEDAGHQPVSCSWQQRQEDQWLSHGPMPLEHGTYLFQTDANGNSNQLILELTQDVLTAR